MRRLTHTLAGLAMLCLAAVASGQQAKKADEVLAPEARQEMHRMIARPGASIEGWDDVYRAALRTQGDATLLIKAIETEFYTAVPASEQQREAARGRAHILHREGRLTEALACAEQAFAMRHTDETGLLRAQLLDGLDKTDDAIKAYEELRAETHDEQLGARIGLRIALLEAMRGGKTSPASAAAGTSAIAAAGVPAVALTTAVAAGSVASVPAIRIGGAAPSVSASPGVRSSSLSATDAAEATEDPQGPPSALFTFASSPGHDAELRNRASVVLAMLGRPREAIGLFQSEGEGSDLFRQEIRLAEWALNAKAPKEAQEHAWKARAAATLKRDRLYALTVLVEAHRTDKSLDVLIERFAAEPNLDDEARHVWIDLLRETARIDEALELFRRSGEGGFTPEMRRELLEMCREAGREDVLIATYGELIAAEPERIEWREGLSRYWLERGRRDDAQAVWKSYTERFDDASHLIEAANSTRDLGLDDVARACAERCLALGNDAAGALQARMFLFDFEVRHGRVEAALEQLEAFDREADPASPLRLQLSEAFERVGNKKRAAEVLEKIRMLRGADEAEEDLEMRLAWLLSEVGDEKSALERWRNLWRRVVSVPRRRQVEDRLMATASRLGSLSDIAVELEEKLAEGKADDRDASLLVRLYQKVGDAATAAEVVEEHMKKTGADPVATLTEKARVFLGGKDYYHFEKTVRKLIDIDPENRADHLRQLAMSNLERGKPQEARAVLVQLAAEESPSDAAEFEAGVLALAGLNEEAAKTYRKGLAAHPERIDTYLLLANTMRTLGATDRATGMFQYLAENADKDDLFTVAIDGILNMRAKPAVLRWALRVTLERLAGRHDKMYLYQLAGDLYDELKDNEGKLRALESSLAIAGEQRASVLRELMDVAQGQASNSYTVVNGMLVQRHEGGDDHKRLAYGRRLIGLGDLVPPAVYLDLGESFLRSGEVANASKTFSMARDVPDYAAFQRQVAQSFESQQFVDNALAIYERAMASQGIDVSLLLKTGELHEQLGRDERASELYQRGVELLLARHPLVASVIEKKLGDDETSMFERRVLNVGDFEQYFGPLEKGFIATANVEHARALFEAERRLLDDDLRAAAATPLAEGETRKLAGFPRIQHRAEHLRRLGLTFGFQDDIASVDLALLGAFPKDDTLLESLCDVRARLGFTGEAQRLAEASHAPDEVRKKVLARIGVGTAELEHAKLGLADVVGRLLPILIAGDRAQASSLLRGVQLGEAKSEDLPQLQLLMSAALFLDDDGAIVSLGRHTVRAIVQNAKTWEEQRQIDAMLKRARAALDRDSYALIVDALVEAISAKKETFRSYSHLLSELQREIGRPLFSADDLRKRMEDCLPDESYLLTSLLDLAPLEQRFEILQGVWPKVPATDRADVALGVLSLCTVAAPPALAEFIAGAFEGGLEKLDDPRSLTYALRNAYDAGDANLAIVLRLAELANRKYPANLAFTAVLAGARMRLKQDDAGLAAMRDALPLIASEDEEWTAREAGETIVDTLVPAHTDALVAELDKLEAGGANERLAELRMQVFDKLDDADGKLAALEKAVEQNPDSIALRRQLYWEYSSRGDQVRSVHALEQLIEADKEEPDWRDNLVNVWRGLRNPLRALEVKHKGQKQKTEKLAAEAKKLEPATIAAVKKAVDEGRAAEANSTYRRTWRKYGPANTSGFMIFSYYFGSQGPTWPEKEGEEESDKHSRGGLDDLQLDEPEKEPKTPKSAYDALAELDFGRDELERQVRSLGENELQSSRSLFHGLQRAEVKALGPDKALANWLELAKSGRAGTVDRALLLSYFEDHLDALSAADRGVLADLVPAVHPLDGAQLRALARIHAKLGETARASRIYQWCATLATSNRWGNDARGSISAYDLLKEVPEQLHGEDLFAAVDAILTRCDPGGDLWERESYVALVIESWTKIAGPVAARQRCKEQLAKVVDLQHGILREPAGPAATLYAATGDTELALRCLEIALCSFTTDQVHFDRDDAYSIRWKLRPQGLAYTQMRKLFPKDASDAWLAAVSAKLLEWDTAGRLEKDVARRLLAVVALRLHQKGNDAAAQALLTRIDGQARASASQQHIVIDLARLLGHEDRARALEDQLLASNALDPERVPEVVARIKSSQGAAQALAAAERAAEWTPHPKLVDTLIALATELHQLDAEARWTQFRTDSLAAAKELEAKW